MKCRNASLVAVSVVLSCGGNLAPPAEMAIRAPQTVAARVAAQLISSAERAIRRYLDACESAEPRDPFNVVTRDARIEYTLDSPGALLSLEASSLFAGCDATAALTPQAGNFRIFASGTRNTVFVQYDMPVASSGTKPPEQLALVEMRGERIHLMRNFGAAPAPLLAAMRGKAQSELCARLSQYDARLADNTTVHSVQSLHFEVAAAASAP